MTSTDLAHQERRSLTTSTELDQAAITALFPRVAATTIVLLVLLISIRGHSGAACVSSLGENRCAPPSLKIWDKAAFVLSVVGAVLVAVRFLRGSLVKPSRLALLISVTGILCGIAIVERPTLTAKYWEGFGISVALVCVPLSLLIVPISRRVRRSQVLGWVLAVPSLALAAIDGLSLVRDAHNFANQSNNVFVLNEVLAPAAGRVPGADFITQYTTLFGWFLAPFRHLLSPYGLANVSIVMLSGLGIAAVVLAALLAWRTLPANMLWLAVGVTVPLTTVTVFHGVLGSSLGSYLQELPIRMFPAMLYSTIAVSTLVALLQRSVPRTPIIALGILGGLMAWNSQDFGVAVPIAYAIVLQIASRGALRKQATLLWLSGLVPGLLLYPLWTLAIGHPIRISYLALTARSFGSGFASALIQVPGPVLLLLPVILGSVTVGACLLWQAVERSDARPLFQQHALVTLAFVGMWSTGSLIYYLGRSFASGQLQIFLLPFGVCCCALLSLCSSAIPDGAAHFGPDVLAYLKGRGVWLLPVTIPITVGFGAALQTPFPSVSLHALGHPSAAIAFPRNGAGTIAYSLSAKDISLAQTYARDHGNGTVGYFGANANYLTLLTGVHPRILYDDPQDFLLGSAAHHLGCTYVRHDATEWLLVAPGVTSIVGPKVCGAYETWPIPGEAPGTLFRLRGSISRGNS